MVMEKPTASIFRIESNPKDAGNIFQGCVGKFVLDYIATFHGDK
jgi:hypothetical protein